MRASVRKRKRCGLAKALGTVGRGRPQTAAVPDTQTSRLTQPGAMSYKAGRFPTQASRPTQPQAMSYTTATLWLARLPCPLRAGFPAAGKGQASGFHGTAKTRELSMAMEMPGFWRLKRLGSARHTAARAAVSTSASQEAWVPRDTRQRGICLTPDSCAGIDQRDAGEHAPGPPGGGIPCHQGGVAWRMSWDISYGM